MLKLPKEDGAWWMALTCWACGWAASLRLAWEPLLTAGAFLCGMVAAHALRAARRLWRHDRPEARRSIPLVVAASLIGLATLGTLYLHVPEPGLWALVAAPAAAYAGILIAGKERRPAARVLAVISLTALTPATYAAAAGMFGAPASILWASLGCTAEKGRGILTGKERMPKISEFFGIAIYMFYREHGVPHFHARYGEHRASIEIDSLRILAGRLPPRVMGLVVEWGSQHQEDLRRVWAQAKSYQPLDRIEPLK